MSDQNVRPSAMSRFKELEEEERFLNTLRKSVRRVKIDDGHTWQLRILPYETKVEGRSYIRLAQHWWNNTPTYCPTYTPQAWGGNPEHICPVCEVADRLNDSGEEAVRNIAYRARVTPRYRFWVVVFDKEDHRGNVDEQPTEELLNPYEFDMYPTTFEYYKKFQKWATNRSRGGKESSEWGMLDLETGFNVLATHGNKGVTLDRCDPSPIFEINDPNWDKNIKLIWSRIKEPRIIMPSDHTLRELAEKIEEYAERKASGRGGRYDDDDRRGGGGRGRGGRYNDDDDRRGGRGRGRGGDDYEPRGRGRGREEDEPRSRGRGRDDDSGSSNRDEPRDREESNPPSRRASREEDSAPPPPRRRQEESSEQSNPPPRRRQEVSRESSGEDNDPEERNGGRQERDDDRQSSPPPRRRQEESSEQSNPPPRRQAINPEDVQRDQTDAPSNPPPRRRQAQAETDENQDNDGDLGPQKRPQGRGHPGSAAGVDENEDNAPEERRDPAPPTREKPADDAPPPPVRSTGGDPKPSRDTGAMADRLARINRKEGAK